MKRVLFVSRLNEESVGLKREICRNPEFHVDMATTAQQALDEITTSRVDLCVLNMDTFHHRKLKLAEDFRSLGYRFPVLVLAETIGSDSLISVTALESTVLLEKPFEGKDLQGLTEKLSHGRSVKQRVWRRFYTNTSAHMEPFQRNQSFNGRMRNISKGGAFMEYRGGVLREGDLVNVTVELREVQRRYNVAAKVIWTIPKSPWGEGRGAGLEFLSRAGVYQNMIQSL